MPVTFNQFTQTNTVNSTDRVVGYTTPAAGGERSWPAGLFAIPTGGVIPFAGQNAPAGWLPCDGRSTSGYAALAAVVGTNVPDLRGYFIRGAGTNADGTASGSFGQKQTDTIAAHEHSYNTPSQQSVSRSTAGGGAAATSGPVNTFTTTYNGPIASETRPKNIALLYIIKT